MAAVGWVDGGARVLCHLELVSLTQRVQYESYKWSRHPAGSLGIPGSLPFSRGVPVREEGVTRDPPIRFSRACERPRGKPKEKRRRLRASPLTGLYVAYPSHISPTAAVDQSAL